MKFKWIGFVVISCVLGILLPPVNLRHYLHLNFLSLIIGLIIIFSYLYIYDLVFQKRTK